MKFWQDMDLVEKALFFVMCFMAVACWAMAVFFLLTAITHG